MSDAQWHLYKNFTKSEFDCKETGENGMNHEFMLKLQYLRTVYKKPMVVTSGFRSVNHSIEKSKARPGVHTTGYAADIAVSHSDAHELLRCAFYVGFAGIGVNQKGNARFIHIDDAPVTDWPRPNVWSY